MMEIPWAIGETKVEMVFMQFEQRDPKYRNAGLDGGFPSIETGNAYFDLTNTNNAFDALDQLSVMFVHKWSDTWDSMV